MCSLVLVEIDGFRWFQFGTHEGGDGLEIVFPAFLTNLGQALERSLSTLDVTVSGAESEPANCACRKGSSLQG